MARGRNPENHTAPEAIAYFLRWAEQYHHDSPAITALRKNPSWRAHLWWWRSQNDGLWRHNLMAGGNDDQIRRMTDRYGFPLASND
jgi:hypothetical protein